MNIQLAKIICKRWRKRFYEEEHVKEKEIIEEKNIEKLNMKTEER